MEDAGPSGMTGEIPMHEPLDDGCSTFHPPFPGGFFVRGWTNPGFRISALLALVLGTLLTTSATRQGEVQRATELTARLETAEATLTARTGELALVRMELDRLESVHQASAHHGIPADLAAAIHDIALAEGIDPELAYSLVAVESRFLPRAVSSVGAVGLTQVMPSTAHDLEPGISLLQLLDERTNLTLGFRYLRQLVHQYDGDLRLALLAYNRGPGTVDSVLRFGGDPGNGYARKVLGGRRGD